MFHVLVIGAGTMGSTHAAAYAAMDNVKLVGIVDIQTEKYVGLAQRLNAPIFATYEDAMTNIEQVDIVDICLPTYLHKIYVKKAANAGKHVICEKPLARNLEDAREIIEVCKQNNVKLFVGHVLRFFPEYKEAKAQLDQGAIGNPAIVRTTRGGAFPQAWNHWYADFQNSGGLVLDMIIHDFDFLRWCFGDVERVYAKGLLGRGSYPLEYSLVTLRFVNGIIAHVEGTWSHESFSMKFEIAGKTGILDYDSSKDQPLVAVSRGGRGSSGGVAVPESPLKENPYYTELKHFLSCIEKGNDPIVSAEDAFEAMRIALAAIESMQTGQQITLR
ncbi:Gfo/Idh/MocA family oxidoreductase [Paenibacillus frigoriresistens]|uniref:Gfo/Idh/MocA family protein n=1 Tax=Paenibacillus alginolyticus TaxID=59839 RepID=UPI0015660266|nr:Gfo/Idh/MocA family oxidoreductase [Paenibacillus frigoriresistens]NRF95725.1 Gfo/Idh/MocA family oxidoreductase [Paenibacillus frigoriresistens]